MTDKELRHISKTDLLRLLRDQEAELARLQSENETLRRQLEDRQIRLDRCGSIAEASLEISGVFTAAQLAAEQYLTSVRAASEHAEETAQHIESEARRRSEELLRETEETCRRRETDSFRRAETYWTGLKTRLDAFYDSHQGLKEMLSDAGLEVRLATGQLEERA